MTAFTLKIIAMISMVLDHVKYAIPSTKNFATIYLGRIAFPIFAFLIAEGFIHTHSRPKYMLKMLAFAIISQIPFHAFADEIAHATTNLNVLFTFEIALLGLCTIEFFNNTQSNGILKILNYLSVSIILTVILIITYFIHPDYTWFGVSVVWVFYLFRNSKILTSLSYTILLLLYYYSAGEIHNYKMIICSLISLIFICLYNGEQGKKLKYFFYFFYPVHLVILYVLSFNFQ